MTLPDGWRPAHTDTLRLLAAGQRYDDIAAACGISTSTAKGRVSDVIRMLGARNGTSAVAIGYERGLLGTERIGVDTALSVLAAATGYVVNPVPRDDAAACPAGPSCYALDEPAAVQP